MLYDAVSPVPPPLLSRLLKNVPRFWILDKLEIEMRRAEDGLVYLRRFSLALPVDVYAKYDSRTERNYYCQWERSKRSFIVALVISRAGESRL